MRIVLVGSWALVDSARRSRSLVGRAFMGPLGPRAWALPGSPLMGWALMGGALMCQAITGWALVGPWAFMGPGPGIDPTGFKLRPRLGLRAYIIQYIYIYIRVYTRDTYIHIYVYVCTHPPLTRWGEVDGKLMLFRFRFRKA